MELVEMRLICPIIAPFFASVMKKILVPTDFSNNSIDALYFAFDLLRDSGGTVYILSAWDAPSTTRGSVGSLRGKIEEDANEKMAALKAKLDKEEGLPAYETYVREGETVDLILDAARHFGADIVAMGTKGSSGIEEILIGSVAASVIERANLPVLAIPAGAKFSGFKKAVFATDFKKSGESTITRFMNLTSAFGTVIEVLHVCSEASKATITTMENLEKAMDKIRGDRDLRYHILNHESIRDGIVEFMSGHDSELLAMVTKRRGLIRKLFDPSLTQKVAMHVSYPLIAFQAE